MTYAKGGGKKELNATRCTGLVLIVTDKWQD